MRLHFLQYVRGYREREVTGPRDFGTHGHHGMEAWWRSPKDRRCSAAVGAIATCPDPFDRVKLTELLRGYHFWWEQEPLEAVEVEKEFCIGLTNPDTGEEHPYWVLAGKIDAIVRDTTTGEILTVEHKTAKGDISRAGDYWRRLRMDSQVSIYHLAAQALGYDVVGCLYDVIGKPDIEPYKATPVDLRKYTQPKPATRAKPAEPARLYASQRENDETPEEFRVRLVEDIAAHPDLYYQRGRVVRLDSDLVEARRDLWQIADLMTDSCRTSIAPRNPDACHRYGRPCFLLGVCEGAGSLDDDTFTRSTNTHPELLEVV